ncbi:MAG: twin-arginine translocase subunit TatC [Thermodesulfobacteriota bacterium]
MSAQDPSQDRSLQPASGPDPEGREDAAAPVPAGGATDDPSLDPVYGPDGPDAAPSAPAAVGEAAPAGAVAAGGGGEGGAPGADAEEGEDGLPEMGLLDHLNDLRKRLTRSALAVFVGFLACYGFAEEIFNFLLAPLRPYLPEGSGLIFTSPPEAFFTYMLAAAVAGLFLMSPFVFYQLWQFIAPGLYKHERKWIIPIALFSALFFVTGACFAYYMVFPVAFEFFMSYAKDIIQAQLKMEEYFSFTLKLMVAFGVAFELPLFVFFLARLGMVSARSLRKFRQYAILIIFIVAAILTPPDVVSQLSMAGPLLVLYELSIWVAHFFSTKKEPAAEEQDAPAEAATEEKAG